MGWFFALSCWIRILCLLWKMMHIYNNVITCIFWCKILGLFILWYMSCDYTTFVIQPYDKSRINAWQMSRNRKKGFLASYKLWHCYHPSHHSQASGRNFHFLSWLWFPLSPATSQRSGRLLNSRLGSCLPAAYPPMPLMPSSRCSWQEDGGCW